MNFPLTKKVLLCRGTVRETDSTEESEFSSSASPMLRKLYLFRLLALSLFVWLAADPAGAQKEAKTESPPTSFVKAVYTYERVLYHYLMGDALSASKISSEILDAPLPRDKKDRLLLMARLSDQSIHYPNRSYPPFSPSPKEGKREDYLELLVGLYHDQRYQELHEVAKGFDYWASARFFEGLGLIHQRKFAQAPKAMLRIPEKDPLSPYGMIALAQGNIEGGNFQKAEKYLKDLIEKTKKLNYLSDQDDRGEKIRYFKAKSHLLLGQLFFEQERYLDALNQFLAVPTTSALYQEALLGQSWTLIRLGQFSEALPLLQEASKSDLYFSEKNREAPLILGHTFIKTGAHGKALSHFRKVLSSLPQTEKQLEKIIGDPSTPENFYHHLVSGKKVTALSGDQSYFYSLLTSDLRLLSLVEKERVLESWIGILEGEKERIRDKERTLEEKMEGFEALTKAIDFRVGESRKVLRAANRAIPLKINNKTPFRPIPPQWSTEVLYPLTSHTKALNRFLEKKWSDQELLECFNKNLLCHLLNVLQMDLGRERERGAGMLRVWQMMKEDLKNVSGNKPLEVEAEIKAYKKRVLRYRGKGKEVLKSLTALRKGVEKRIEDSKKGREGARREIRQYIADKFMKIKHELANFKSNINDGIEKAQQAAAGSAG